MHNISAHCRLAEWDSSYPHNDRTGTPRKSKLATKRHHTHIHLLMNLLLGAKSASERVWDRVKCRVRLCAFKVQPGRSYTGKCLILLKWSISFYIEVFLLFIFRFIGISMYDINRILLGLVFGFKKCRVVQIRVIRGL